jgi:hypothetical protein
MDSSHLSTIVSGSSGSCPSTRGDANDPTPPHHKFYCGFVASLSTHSALEPPRLPTPVDNSEFVYGQSSASKVAFASASLASGSPTASPVLPPLYIFLRIKLGCQQVLFHFSIQQHPDYHSTSHSSRFSCGRNRRYCGILDRMDLRPHEGPVREKLSRLKSRGITGITSV